MNPSGITIPLPRIGAVPAPVRVRHKISFGMVCALVIWLAVVVGGTILMTRFSNTAGNGGPAPVTWPKDSQIQFDDRRPTLVMFAHPRCPCTRASLGELEELLAQVPDQLSVRLVFLKPAGTAANWEKSDLWRKASCIPGVTVYTDNAGSEARRFHSETSGQTLLYDRSGTLRFQGGITLGRGHAGDNPGRDALQELLRAGHSSQVKTPVFGCPLFEGQNQQEKLTCKP